MLKLNIQRFAEDGKIIIGTEINSSGIDKGIASIESKMEKLRKKAENPYEIDGAKISGGWNLSKEEQAYYDRLETTLNRLKLEKTEMLLTDNKITQQIKQQSLSQEEASSSINQWKNGVMELSNGVKIVKKNIEDIDNETKKINLSGVKNSIDNVGKGIQNVTKKVGRWALAIFGVRSAYMFVRQAMSTLSQYDDQMATNIEYIRYLLASALKPVIETIINLAYKLLAYLNYITQALFGVNLFANASKEAFAQTNKNLKQANKSAKQLQKTLTGFDEANIIQENGNVATGGGGGGITLPNFPDFDDIERPWWMDWLIKNKNEVISALAGITAGLIGLKLGLSPLKALGTGIAVAGIFETLTSLRDYLNDPTWKNFGGIIEGIGLAVAGVAIAFGAWPVAAAGAGVALVGIVAKYWDKIKEKWENAIQKLHEKGDEIEEHYGKIPAAIYDYFVDWFERLKGWADSYFSDLRGIFDGFIEFFKSAFTGDWNSAWEGLKKAAGNLFDWLITFFKIKTTSLSSTIGTKIGSAFSGAFKSVINSMLSWIESKLNSAINSINKFTSVINKFSPVKIGKISTISLPRLAKGGIINMPGRGVPVGYGSAIGGESGHEGVIPLTDSQQMALLGEAIGKYVRIDNVIDVNMDSRKINRILQSSENRQRLAGNR